MSFDNVGALIQKVLDCCGQPEATREVTESDIEEMIELAISAYNQRERESKWR